MKIKAPVDNKVKINTAAVIAAVFAVLDCRVIKHISGGGD